MRHAPPGFIVRHRPTCVQVSNSQVDHLQEVKLLNSILKGRIIWKLGNSPQHVLFGEHDSILVESVIRKSVC
jgi:hypothetical protein